MTAPLDRLSEKLSEIRAYVEAATTGPWRRQGRWITMDDGEPVAEVAEWKPSVEEADAEFIARARTDLPLLLAAARDVLSYLDDLDERDSWPTTSAIRAIIEGCLETEA